MGAKMSLPTKKEFLAQCRNPELAKKVLNQMGTNWSDIIEYPTDYRDAGAGVSGFIYYSETEAFAKRNIELILEALRDFEEEIGESLKKDDSNLLNWYAWFALENTIQEVINFKEGV